MGFCAIQAARIRISIHSLRMEGDVALVVVLPIVCAFQSTPSAWRETGIIAISREVQFYFNPLPPHGGRRGQFLAVPPDGLFQSTPSAWRETYKCAIIYTEVRDFNPLPPHGGRHREIFFEMTLNVFQSTPSAWRETVFTSHSQTLPGISIHSLRMEGDTGSSSSR